MSKGFAIWQAFEYKNWNSAIIFRFILQKNPFCKSSKCGKVISYIFLNFSTSTFSRSSRPVISYKNKLKFRKIYRKTTVPKSLFE